MNWICKTSFKKQSSSSHPLSRRCVQISFKYSILMLRPSIPHRTQLIVKALVAIRHSSPKNRLVILVGLSEITKYSHMILCRLLWWIPAPPRSLLNSHLSLAQLYLLHMTLTKFHRTMLCRQRVLNKSKIIISNRRGLIRRLINSMECQ